jgi:hypothetical protein
VKARISLLIMILAAAACLTGCVAVQPWQREYLADETMQFDPNDLETAWTQHVNDVLEGSRGGFNGSGGGCGCR